MARVSRTTAPRGSTNVRKAASTTIATSTTPTTQSATSRITGTGASRSVVAVGPAAEPLHGGTAVLALHPLLARTTPGAGGPARRRDPQCCGQPADEPGAGELAVLGLRAGVG